MLVRTLLEFVKNHPDRTLKVLDCGSRSGEMWLEGELGFFVNKYSANLSVTLLDALTPSNAIFDETVFTTEGSYCRIA
jgi:hypothetical protein